jgi:DnaJ-class molecular chaperone
MPRDYYIVLGIPTGASLEEIKNAYRRLAKEYHPDLYGDNHSPFLAIQEAYTVLSDPIRRKAYDREAIVAHKERKPERFFQRRRPSSSEVEPLIPEKGPVDIGVASLSRSFRTYHPAYEELFARLFGNFSPSPRPKAERPKNLTIAITLTPAQAFRGEHVRLSVPTRLQCSNCSGSGEVGFYECQECRGEGAIISEQPVIVNYPAGIADNHVVQFPLDRYGIHDLYLTVHFQISELG